MSQESRTSLPDSVCHARTDLGAGCETTAVRLEPRVLRLEDEMKTLHSILTVVHQPGGQAIKHSTHGLMQRDVSSVEPGALSGPICFRSATDTALAACTATMDASQVQTLNCEKWKKCS